MPSSHHHDVAIIGGGFSGAMLAARLVADGGGAPLRVLLIDRTGRFARGLAYSTSNPRHLLNVPAGLMSAVADVPNQFLSWAQTRVAGVDKGSYLPRSLYGDYLASVLEDAIRRRAAKSFLELRVTGARGLERKRPGTHHEVLHLDDGVVRASRVVLATGNAASKPIGLPPIDNPDEYWRYVHDPWAPGALEHLPGTADILIAGTGLTMIDVALDLVGRGHRGRLIAISRRGLMPQPHRSVAPAPTSFLDQRQIGESLRARRLVTLVRDAAARAARAGADWRSVVAELRPVTPDLWRHLGAEGQASFLRHAAPYWETHRHRVAPAVHDVLFGLLATGQLEVRSGRITASHGRGGAIHAVLKPRAGGPGEAVSVSAIVNCAGPDPDVRNSHDPLLLSLLASGTIRPGPHGLGVDADPHGAVISRGGSVSDSVFAIGPLRRGLLWETTAVPEIRAQVTQLALRLRAEGP